MNNSEDAKKRIARVIDKDLPTIGPITKEIREMNKGLFHGRKVYTKKEFEARMKRIDEMKFP